MFWCTFCGNSLHLGIILSYALKRYVVRYCSYDVANRAYCRQLDVVGLSSRTEHIYIG